MSIFNKVKEMDPHSFLEPTDLLGKSNEYINLLVIFLKLRRMECEFDLQKKQINRNPFSENIPSNKDIPLPGNQY